MDTTNNGQTHGMISGATCGYYLCRIAGCLFLAGGLGLALVGISAQLLWVFVPALAILLFLTRSIPRHLFGGGFLLLGGLLIYNFSVILGENLPLLAISVSLVGGGVLLFFSRVGAGTTLVIIFTMGFGLLGWGANSALGNKGVTGVYDPVEDGRAVFLFTEPCFIVDDGEGGVRVIPGGKWGVYPEYPSPSHVGRRIGNHQVIGIVEKGGVINIHNPKGKSVSVLDFSFVTPSASEKGAMVVSGLF